PERRDERFQGGDRRGDRTEPRRLLRPVALPRRPPGVRTLLVVGRIGEAGRTADEADPGDQGPGAAVQGTGLRGTRVAGSDPEGNDSHRAGGPGLPVRRASTPSGGPVRPRRHAPEEGDVQEGAGRAAVATRERGVCLAEEPSVPGSRSRG